MSRVPGALTGALLDAERAERAELPVPGFRVVRRADEEWPVVLDGTGRLLHRPVGRVQRVSSSGTHLALEVAADGSERAHLDLVDPTGRSHRVPAVRLRHGDQAWSGGVLHVVDDAGDLLAVDPTSSPPSVRVVRPARGDRPRLVSVGGRTLLGLSGSSAGGTDVVDLDGRHLLRLPPVRAFRWTGTTALAVTGTGLHLLRAEDGGVVETAHRPQDAVTGGSLVHATATDHGCALHVVREGHSRLLVLDDRLHPTRELEVSRDDDVQALTGLTWCEGALWVRRESPGRPPQLLRLGPGDLTPSEPAGRAAPRSRLLTVAADDGAAVELVVTGDADRPAPTLLEVYGGFGVHDLPGYEPSVAAWCALGGLHVTARVRGGGGAGSAWHAAARGDRKARAVADTVAVARALVAHGLTRADLLVLAGASHGGLVAASAALAEPGLVAAVCVTAAPLDPHRLMDHPLGAAWTAEFGDPADPAVGAAMDDYSPLRRAERWPAGAPLPRFLLTTFAEDGRVDPGSTDRLATTLRRRGAVVERHHRPAMGHGSNARSTVHDFAMSVLGLALAATGATPATRGLR